MKECCTYTNVRPLEAKTNISKGCKFTHDTIVKHEIVVNKFIARRTKGCEEHPGGDKNSGMVITSA